MSVFGTAETVRTCRPAEMRWSYRRPWTMLATVWPSIFRLAARFQPKFATLITMRRPPVLAAALTTETAKEEDENQKKSAGIAGQGPHEFVVARLLSRAHALNAPERAVRAELGYFAGGTFADVNSDGNDTDKRAHENHRHKKRRDVPDAQRSIKRYDIVDRRGRGQNKLRPPCE